MIIIKMEHYGLLYIAIFLCWFGLTFLLLNILSPLYIIIYLCLVLEIAIINYLGWLNGKRS